MAPMRLVESMAEHGIQLIFGIAFLLAIVSAGLLRRRSLIEAGVIFVLLGIAAGPLGLGLAPAEETRSSSLFVSLLSGWVALQIGLGLSFRSDGQLVPGALRAGVLYSVVGILGLGVATFGVLHTLLGGADESFWAYPALVIAAASVTAAPGAMLWVADAHDAQGPVRNSSASLARVVRGLAIIVLSLVAAVAEPQTTVDGFRALAPAERVLGEVMLGVTFGFFADVFLGKEPDDRRLVAILIGLSLLASGLSSHLGLSPMLVNLLIGGSLANYGHLSSERHHAAETLEGPSRKLLLVFMGAAWLPPESALLWLVVLLIFGARIATLRIAGGVAGRAFDPNHAGFRVIGFTMVAQGAPALAIALSFARSADPMSHGVILSVILLSAVLNDLWAPRAARIVLDEAGEIPTTPVEA